MEDGRDLCDIVVVRERNDSVLCERKMNAGNGCVDSGVGSGFVRTRHD